MKRLLFLAAIALISCNREKIERIPIKSGDKWGYIDKTGKYVINAQFEEAHFFRNGLALVKSNENKYGYINREGKFEINAIYKNANSFAEGLACVVQENGKPQFIDTDGKIVFTVDAEICSGFSEGLAAVQIKGKWGYIDKTGAIKINPAYEEANRFSEGLAAVSKTDQKTNVKKWGFIDKEGGIKIDFQFLDDTVNFCSPGYFSEGLAFVSNDGKKWGCINKEGNYEINPQFEGGINWNYEYHKSYGFKNGIAAVKQGDNWGFINKKGNFIINPQFMSVHEFTGSGKAAVQNSDTKYGFIDEEGKYVVNPQFENVKLGFIEDFAIVESSDKYGIINEKGTYSVNPQYDGVWICSACWFSGVKSDFVDDNYIANVFFENSTKNKIRDISSETTLKEISEMFPNASMDDLKNYQLDMSEPTLTIAEALQAVEISVFFSEVTHTKTPVYKTVKRYNSWYGGYYNDTEVDYYDKTIHEYALVSAISYSWRLNRDGSGKSKKIADTFRDVAIKKCSMKIQEHTEIKNNEENGVHILRNENLLLYLAYHSIKDDENKTVTPLLSIAVINNNYTESFDEQEKRLIDGFLKIRKKQNS